MLIKAVWLFGCFGCLLTARVFSIYVPHFQGISGDGMSFSQNSAPFTFIRSSCSALFTIIDGRRQRRLRAWRSSSENRSCIWMIKESRRGIASLLVMIDWTGTYIITYKGPVIIYHLGAGGGGGGGGGGSEDLGLNTMKFTRFPL